MAPLPAPARKDWMVDAIGEPKRSSTEALACWLFLAEAVFFVLDCAESLVFWMKVTEDPAIRSTCRMVQTRCWRTLGSGPRTWDPSKGTVRTVFRTWGWHPKFWNNASRRSSWRQGSAANPALNDEDSALWDSGSVVFYTGSSSFKPCAILAVDAIVSVSEGWSNRETWSVTSPSPRSSREALAALLDLARLRLNDPLEEVTVWEKIWYWPEENFRLKPSSSSLSESVLSLPVPPGSQAALKSTGDPSLAGDSEVEDVLSRDLERVLILGESTKSRHLLTGVQELLTGDFVVSLSLYGEGDKSINLFCAGTVEASNEGVAVVSGAQVPPKRLCMIIIMDKKSSKPAWLNCLGKDGKNKLPSSHAEPWSAGVYEPAVSTASGMASFAESVTSAESAALAKSAHLAGSATIAGSADLESSKLAGRTGDWIPVMVLHSGCSVTVEVRSISFPDTCKHPGMSVESPSCCLERCWEGRDLWSTLAQDDWEGRDLWSTVALLTTERAGIPSPGKTVERARILLPWKTVERAGIPSTWTRHVLTPEVLQVSTMSRLGAGTSRWSRACPLTFNCWEGRNSVTLDETRADPGGPSSQHYV